MPAPTIHLKIAAQYTYHLVLYLPASVTALKLCLLMHVSRATQEHKARRQDARTHTHWEFFHNEILGSRLNGKYGIRFTINSRAIGAGFFAYNLQDCERWNKEICALLKAGVGG
jgi:hypothetical protein